MKPKIVKIALSLLATLCIAIIFQNCAPEGSFKAKSSQAVHQASLMVEDPVKVDEKIKTNTLYESVLADRYYLKSLLEDVFGPSTSAADTNKIFLNALEFGSACNLYESQLDSAEKVVNAMENCSPISSNRLIPSVSAKATAARQGLIARTCSDLVLNATTLSYALKRISTKDKIPAGTRSNVLNLYRLFYRGKPSPTNGLVDSLELIVNQKGKPTNDTWRSAIYTVCASSYWQVL